MRRHLFLTVFYFIFLLFSLFYCIVYSTSSFYFLCNKNPPSFINQLIQNETFFHIFYQLTGKTGPANGTEPPIYSIFSGSYPGSCTVRFSDPTEPEISPAHSWTNRIVRSGFYNLGCCNLMSWVVSTWAATLLACSERASFVRNSSTQNSNRDWHASKI
jgi:hypothetical protein